MKFRGEIEKRLLENQDALSRLVLSTEEISQSKILLNLARIEALSDAINTLHAADTEMKGDFLELEEMVFKLVLKGRGEGGQAP